MSEATTLTRWIATTPAAPWQAMPLPAPSAGTDTLALTAARHQRWEGFGGCFNELGWIALGALDESARAGVFANLFDPQGEGCRFTLGRGVLPRGLQKLPAQHTQHGRRAAS